MFRQELKDNVKDEIMRDKRNYESLIELIEIVMIFNDKLYERAMEKRYDHPHNRASIDCEPVIEYAKPKTSYIKNL